MGFPQILPDMRRFELDDYAAEFRPVPMTAHAYGSGYGFMRTNPCSSRSRTKTHNAEAVLFDYRDLGDPLRRPRGGLPPRSTVYNLFRNFKCDGVWDAVWESQRMDLREELGRQASPTAAVSLTASH